MTCKKRDFCRGQRVNDIENQAEKRRARRRESTPESIIEDVLLSEEGSKMQTIVTGR